MKNLVLLCLSALLGCSLQSSGQVKVRYLTLPEAIELAKTLSPDALNAKQNFRTSYWEFRSYRASNLPALSLTSLLPDYYQGYRLITDTSGRSFYAGTQNIGTNLALSLSQKIGLTGGTISVNSFLQGNWDINVETALPYLSNPVNVNLQQPLFQYNPYRWNRKIEPLKYSQAKRKYVEDIEQIAIVTVGHFFNLLQAQAEQKIARVNLSNYDTMYHIAKGRFQLGKIAENDLLQMELNYLKAQSAVENSTLNLENAQFRLKSYLRIQDTLPVRLVAPSDIGFFEIDPAEAIRAAVDYSSATLGFNKRLLEAASQVNSAKLQDRFDANINASVGLTKTGATFPEVYKQPDNNLMFRVDLTIPILDWGVARGRIKMAQSEEEVTKNNVEQERIDFQHNVYIRAIQCNMQKNQVRIAAKSDTVAKKSFEVTKSRYLIGKINSILDLNNAQIESDAAEKAYYAALETYWQNYYEIRRLTLYDFRNKAPIQFNFSDVK